MVHLATGINKYTWPLYTAVNAEQVTRYIPWRENSELSGEKYWILNYCLLFCVVSPQLLGPPWKTRTLWQWVQSILFTKQILLVDFYQINSASLVFSLLHLFSKDFKTKVRHCLIVKDNHFCLSCDDHLPIWTQLDLLWVRPVLITQRLSLQLVICTPSGCAYGHMLPEAWSHISKEPFGTNISFAGWNFAGFIHQINILLMHPSQLAKPVANFFHKPSATSYCLLWSFRNLILSSRHWLIDCIY